MVKTKTQLGNALKQLSCEKAFSRISVSDITAKYDLNRQTFYYHFQDKYECLEWVYYHECLLPIQEINEDNWEKHFESMFNVMANESQFYIASIYDNPRVFMISFKKVTKELFSSLIRNTHQDENYEIDEEFISDFLVNGILGIIMEWVHKGMKVSPLELSSKIKNMAEGMRIAKANFSKK